MMFSKAVETSWNIEIGVASSLLATALNSFSLNSVIRQATKKRKIFPTDDSVRKVVYLAIEAASKKWNMPIRDWRTAMSRFLIEFEDRLGNFM
jgi:transposase-like protein